MIDQQLTDASDRRARRRLRTLGTAALIALGLAGGLFVTLPAVSSVLWVAGSYLLFGDRGTEHILETLQPLQPREQLPDPGPAPSPPTATQDVEGAVAAARHFVAAYEYGYTTSDPSELEAVSTPQCATCTFATGALHLAEQRDVRFYGIHFEPTAVAVTSFTPERAVVHLSVRTSDAVAHFAGNGVMDLRDLGGGQVENDVVLVWEEDRWLVDSLDGGLWAPGLEP